MTSTLRNLCFLLLGLVAVAVSTIGVVSAFRATAPDGRPAEETSPSPALSGGVCVGFVDLEYGATTLTATRTGRVVEVLVGEQQSVKAAQSLVRLEDGPARAAVTEARAAAALAQLRLEQARQAPARHKLALARQQDGIAAAEKRLEAARVTLEHKRRQAATNLVTDYEVQLAKAQEGEASAALSGERKRLAEMKLHNPETEVRSAEIEQNLRKAQLDQAELTLEECTLRAPRAGRVIRIHVTPGEVLAPGRQALLFAGDGPLIVRAELEQDFAGLVKPGQTVRVIGDLHPTPVWQGKVRRLSGWYLQRRSVLNEPSRFNDLRTQECIIALEPGGPPLVLGQRMRVLLGDVSP